MDKLNLFFSKSKISFGAFVFINFIFLVKYLERITDYYLILSLVFSCFYLIVWNYSINIKNFRLKGVHNLILMLVFIGLSIFVFDRIDVNSLRVDRWSVITSFWDNFFENKYVYFAKSNRNNYPGPMPFYFILALPFYAIKELGFLTIVGILLFYYILKKEIKLDNNLFIGLLLTISSVFIFWEIACRSNIFFNGVIVLLVLKRILDTHVFNTKELLVSGILIGLSLSTRNVFVIPFIIAFCYLLRIKQLSFKETISVGIVALITFGVTFLPFIWNHFEDFKIMNPFIIQSSFLMPFELTLVFIVLAFVLSFVCKVKDDVYFFSAFTLFITIIGYYFYYFYTSGFDKTFFDSQADISYFILSTPFFMYYFLLKKKG